MPRPRFQPTDEQRRLVKTLAAWDLNQLQIADIIGRSTKTLRKYCGPELRRGGLEGYAKVKQTHFQMATDGKHWPATKAWQESYDRRHGQGPDQGGPGSCPEADKSNGAQKRVVSRIVWRTAERPKPPAPPEPTRLASPRPTEPVPVPSDFLASDEAEKQQTEGESPTVITLQAENAKEWEEDDALD